jgi:hypothetical protein
MPVANCYRRCSEGWRRVAAPSAAAPAHGAANTGAANTGAANTGAANTGAANTRARQHVERSAHGAATRWGGKRCADGYARTTPRIVHDSRFMTGLRVVGARRPRRSESDRV